jgi:hypothetical protein
VLRIALLCFLVVAGLLPASARAQACAGFTDITVFSPFCTNVQWMKNRAVTLGCTATTYCPNDPVNRLQMAAFMNRVGNVLTPRVLSVEQSGGALDLANFSFLCQTADVPDATYNREVHADGSFSFDATGPGLLQLSVFASNDSGATWQPAPVNDVVVTVTMSGAGRDHASLTLKRKELFSQLGTPTRYGIRVVRGSNLTTATLTGWTCHFQVVVTTKAE